MTLQDVARAAPAGARLLGLDVGAKTLGVAVSDPNWRVATPVGVIKRRALAEDVRALKAYVETHRAGGLVLGLPMHMNGQEGARCQSTRQFARNLERSGLLLPVVFQDERLSTQETERILRQDAGLSRRRRGQVVDKLAATVILQAALDAWNNRPVCAAV